MSSRRLIYTLVAVSLLAAASIGLIVSPISSGAGRASSTGQATSFNFALVVNGQTLGFFSELVGLSSGFETSQLDLTLGAGEPKLTVPSRLMPPSVMLRRGLTTNRDLSDWHEDALENASRAWKDAELVAYDETLQPVARWKMLNAWPSKVEIGTLKMGSSDVAMETVTLVCERIQRVSP